MSSDHDKRIVVYPHYIWSGKTVAEGRRVPKELACETPDVVVMQESCKELQIPSIIEDKHYPRDWFIRCRLRVELKKQDGTLHNPSIPNRESDDLQRYGIGNGWIYTTQEGKDRSQIYDMLPDRVYDITSGRTLLIRIAELVPKHRKNHPLPPGMYGAAAAAAAAAASSDSSPAVGGSASSGKGNNKKKKGK